MGSSPSLSPREPPRPLPVLHPRAAGVDVHSDMHMVCVPAECVAPAPPEPGGLPRHVRRFGANTKTDVLDAQWIQRLHSYGLLRPSFRPPETIRALRGYQRQRQMQVRYAASHVNHVQKALEQMNVKLTEVVSDVMGLTGRKITRTRSAELTSVDKTSGTNLRPASL